MALKQTIKINKYGGDEVISVTMGEVNRIALRFGTLASATGSVFGCGFLVLALVNLVQIKLGTLACGSVYTFAAVVPLVTLVPSALVIYVFLVLHAFAR